MVNIEAVRAATLDRVGDLVDDTSGVHLRGLPPFTTLVVWTTNSRYRVVVVHWPEVCVQEDALFPAATSACIDRARFGGRCFRIGWICAGLLLEIPSGGQHIIASPVLAITTEQASSLVVH